jgi:hypothetical protein
VPVDEGVTCEQVDRALIHYPSITPEVRPVL